MRTVAMLMPLFLNIHIEGINVSSLNYCKLSIIGYDYAGSLSRTVSGYRCRYWNSLNLDSEKIQNENFIDGSINLAKDYCRNPTNDPKGPWCYTSNPKVKSEFCNVPICFNPECRISSLGSEYAGKLSKSASGSECEEWKIGSHPNKSEFTFAERNFPNENLGPEKRSCRNPSGNSAGPWCWVKINHIKKNAKDDGSNLVAELCDIPFCDEPDCLIFTNGRKLHHHFISLTGNKQNVTFWLKPWLINKWIPERDGKQARLFLSTSPSPYGSGFELKIPLFGGVMELRYISCGENREGTNLVMGAEEEDTENYLVRKIAVWNKYNVVWTQKDIVVYSTSDDEDKNEILQLLYETKDSDLQKEQEEDFTNIRYISSSGEPTLWGLACDESRCPVHTIYDSDMNHWERLHRTTIGIYLQFNVRAFGVVGIVLASTPLNIGTRIKIKIGKTDGTFGSIGIKEKNKSKYKYKVIKDGNNEGINLTYWEWKEFSLSLIGDQIQMHAISKESAIGTKQTILDIRHSAARLIQWYSISSLENSISHWTFYCSPEENDEVPPALPPECVVSNIGTSSQNYVGYQWVTHTGKPCLPWTSPSVSKVLPSYNPQFKETDLRDARDFCRNPTGGPLGPWCFRLGKANEYKDANGTIELVAEQCGVRLCRYAECRMSGLGTEYIGNLSRTISGRECQRWDASIPHRVPESLLNSTLHADLNITLAGAFCRNPSRNNAGPWCFTLDPNVTIDVCDVKDCTRSDECTNLVRGEGKGRLLYVLPQWKMHGLKFSLKEWDPDLTDGLVFFLSTSKEGRFKYPLHQY